MYAEYFDTFILSNNNVTSFIASSNESNYNNYQSGLKIASNYSSNTTSTTLKTTTSTFEWLTINDLTQIFYLSCNNWQEQIADTVIISLNSEYIIPTQFPTQAPSVPPTAAPSRSPTMNPTIAPTLYPTRLKDYTSSGDITYYIFYVPLNSKIDIGNYTDLVYFVRSSNKVRNIIESSYVAIESVNIDYSEFYLKFSSVVASDTTVIDNVNSNITFTHLTIKAKIYCVDSVIIYFKSVHGESSGLQLSFEDYAVEQFVNLFNSNWTYFNASSISWDEIHSISWIEMRYYQVLVSICVVVAIVSVLAWVHGWGGFNIQCCGCTKVDGVKWLYVCAYGLQIYDVFSDVYFSYVMVDQSSTNIRNSIEIKNIDFVLLVLAFVSSFCVIVPYVLNLRVATTLTNRVGLHPVAEAWFHRNIVFFCVLVLLSGGVCSSINLVTSRIFGIRKFDCGINSRDFIYFKKIHLKYSVYLENIPQIICQIVYFYRFGVDSDSLFVGVALFSSAFSALNAVVSYLFRQHLISHSKNIVIILDADIGRRSNRDHRQLSLHKGYRVQLRSRIAAATALDFNRVELFYINTIEHGCQVYISYMLDSSDRDETNMSTPDRKRKSKSKTKSSGSSSARKSSNGDRDSDNKENSISISNDIDDIVSVSSRNSSMRKEAKFYQDYIESRVSQEYTFAEYLQIRHVIKTFRDKCQDFAAIPKAMKEVWKLESVPQVSLVYETNRYQANDNYNYNHNYNYSNAALQPLAAPAASNVTGNRPRLRTHSAIERVVANSTPNYNNYGHGRSTSQQNIQKKFWSLKSSTGSKSTDERHMNTIATLTRKTQKKDVDKQTKMKTANSGSASGPDSDHSFFSGNNEIIFDSDRDRSDVESPRASKGITPAPAPNGGIKYGRSDINRIRRSTGSGGFSVSEIDHPGVEMMKAFSNTMTNINNYNAYAVNFNPQQVNAMPSGDDTITSYKSLNSHHTPLSTHQQLQGFPPTSVPMIGDHDSKETLMHGHENSNISDDYTMNDFRNDVNHSWKLKFDILAKQHKILQDKYDKLEKLFKEKDTYNYNPNLTEFTQNIHYDYDLSAGVYIERLSEVSENIDTKTRKECLVQNSLSENRIENHENAHRDFHSIEIVGEECGDDQSDN